MSLESVRKRRSDALTVPYDQKEDRHTVQTTFISGHGPDGVLLSATVSDPHAWQVFVLQAPADIALMADLIEALGNAFRLDREFDKGEPEPEEAWHEVWLKLQAFEAAP